MKNNKLKELFILIYRCFFVFLLICIVARLIGSALVLIKFGYFPIDWREVLFLSSKNALIISLILGSGIWIKVRLQERKDQQPPSE